MSFDRTYDPHAALFPDPATRKTWEDYLTVALIDALSQVADRRVSPTGDVATISRCLTEFDFENPIPLGTLLPWAIEQLQTGVVQLTHPHYFGLFNPAPTFPAECADRIVAGFNPQLATSTTSPAAVAIEAHVIKAVARRIGLPEQATGHFTSGGTEANFTALICALSHANPNFGAEGVTAFKMRPTFYISEDAHLAWFKIAHQAGIGRSAARLVPTDESGRMDIEALRLIVQADQARGRRPVMIVATAGTTSAGMIDRLAASAKAAREIGAWFHVDAAWGGALIASERLRHVLDGIELADSVTIDAHKWFATTMGCGMFLTRHKNILADIFHVTTDYMPSNIPDLDPYVSSLQWSRRFLGLRLFLSLAAAGWQGYAAHVERSIELIGQLRRTLSAAGWHVANESPLAVLCAEPPEGYPQPQEMVRDVVASGLAWISLTVFRKRSVIRMCVTNGRTTSDDIQTLVNVLQSFKHHHEPAAGGDWRVA